MPKTPRAMAIPMPSCAASRSSYQVRAYSALQLVSRMVSGPHSGRSAKTLHRMEETSLIRRRPARLIRSSVYLRHHRVRTTPIKCRSVRYVFDGWKRRSANRSNGGKERPGNCRSGMSALRQKRTFQRWLVAIIFVGDAISGHPYGPAGGGVPGRIQQAPAVMY